MKKLFYLAPVVLIFLLSACAKSATGDYVLAESGDNYKLYAYSDEDGILTDYVYLIFSNAGVKIDSGYDSRGVIGFDKFDNDILKVTVSAGTYAAFTTYYNLETGLVSEEYENVCYDDGEITAYTDYVESDSAQYIVIKNIFDSNYLLKEELDTGGVFITGFTVTVDGSKVTVEHAKGEDYQDITETFYLV